MKWKKTLIYFCCFDVAAVYAALVIDPWYWVGASIGVFFTVGLFILDRPLRRRRPPVT